MTTEQTNSAGENAAAGEVSQAALVASLRQAAAGGVGVIWAQAAGAVDFADPAAAAAWVRRPGGGAIGRNGDMPWHLPADLKWFQEVTKNSTVIMGRRTWHSLPPRFRPLPHRRNIVVTRSSAAFAGAETAASVPAALALAAENADAPVWVIGGGKIYDAALEHATVTAITQLGLNVPDADTYAPALSADWQLVGHTAPAGHQKSAPATGPAQSAASIKNTTPAESDTALESSQTPAGQNAANPAANQDEIPHVFTAWMRN